MQAQLQAHADPRQLRIDVRQAPLLRGYAAFDASGQRWLLQLLFHHLVMDHTTLEQLAHELALIEQGRQAELPPPVPFRNFVAQARLGVSAAGARSLLHPHARRRGRAHRAVRAAGRARRRRAGERSAPGRARRSGAARARASTRQGVSAASVFHLAWAQVLAKTSGRDDVVFGTVLFGRMQGGAGADRALGLFINTLPVRIGVGEQPLEQALRRTHDALSELLHHEHATLALAQRCSGVPAGTPLFSALAELPPQPGRARRPGASKAWRCSAAQERTNYPLALSVDDLGAGFALTAQVCEPMPAERICELHAHGAGAPGAGAGASAAHAGLRRIEVLPQAERQQVLHAFNDTQREYPQDALIHELFEAAGRAQPAGHGGAVRRAAAELRRAQRAGQPAGASPAAAWAWGPTRGWPSAWSAASRWWWRSWPC